MFSWIFQVTPRPMGHDVLGGINSISYITMKINVSTLKMVLNKYFQCFFPDSRIFYMRFKM